MSDPAEIPQEDMVWEVTHLRANKSTIVAGSMLQKSPFIKGDKPTSSLDLEFLIKPEGNWNLHTKYARCVVASITYKTGDYVFVKPPVTDKSKAQSKHSIEEADVRDCWVAKILEIRAEDEECVYARVYWMYWPDDLPVINDCGISASGRRSYHGTHELIASNHMDILSVCTFAGPATVSYLSDEDDGNCQDGLYWRQTYDYRSRHLSALIKYCICEQYYNPDKVIVSCPNLDCNLWLHTDCLIDSILTKKCQALDGSTEVANSSTVTKKRKNKKRKLSTVVAKKAYIGIFSAEIIGGEESDSPQVEITDLRADVDNKSRTWKEAIACPKCSTKIE